MPRMCTQRAASTGPSQRSCQSRKGGSRIMASWATLDYCGNLLNRQEVARCVENVATGSPGYVPGEQTLEVFPTCAVPPVILNRGFKKVACQGLQALPRGNAHQP